MPLRRMDRVGIVLLRSASPKGHGLARGPWICGRRLEGTELKINWLTSWAVVLEYRRRAGGGGDVHGGVVEVLLVEGRRNNGNGGLRKDARESSQTTDHNSTEALTLRRIVERCSLTMRALAAAGRSPKKKFGNCCQPQLLPTTQSISSTTPVRLRLAAHDSASDAAGIARNNPHPPSHMRVSVGLRETREACSHGFTEIHGLHSCCN